MPFAATARRPVVGVGAVLCLLALAIGALAWRAGGAAAVPQPAVAAGAVTADVPATSTTAPSSTSTSSSTSTTSTSSTSTTVKPKPVTTTAAPRRATIPATTPPPATAAAPAPPPVAVPAASSAGERCAAARQWVAEHGLAVPAGWGFRCPGPAIVGGVARSGMACWNCEGNGSNWIAIDVGRIGASDVWLRHVIAHEICHAIDYMGLGITTELTADLCAALHGAPRP